MTEEEANHILDTANYLLKNFPHENPKYRMKKSFRRKPHLRSKYIHDRKVFFDFLHEKYAGLNKRDKARRYYPILFLRDIFYKEIPVKKDATYIYISEYMKKPCYTLVANQMLGGSTGFSGLFLFKHSKFA